MSEVATADGAMTVLVTRDATLRQAVEQELIAARDAAIAAQRAQTTFLANMSHELRTPLNGILGYTQVLLLEQHWDEQQASGLRTIRSSGEHLLTLINDILDIAKIEAGRLELVSAPVQLDHLLQAVADLIRIRAEQKDLAFAMRVHGKLPPAVLGDERRLRQVLLNLLGNAVKFTERGEVRLDVHVLDGAPAGSLHLRFAVRDTGIGIVPAQQSRLFRPFEQVGDPTRRAAGSGLGLSISRQLVRLMGNDILVSSAPDAGSTFSFELQLPTLAAGVDELPAQRAVVGYAGAIRRVLIVDDVAENREMLAYLLRQVGFQIDEAENGRAALDHARALRPDLVLMDMMMPVVDGAQATRLMRGDPQLAEVPIVIISASVTQEDQRQWRAAGGNAFIAKPISRDQLLLQVGELLGIEWTHRLSATGDDAEPASPARPEVVPPQALPPPEDLQALHRLVMKGDIAAIDAEAVRLLALDARYQPFTDKVRRLAKAYQTKALSALLAGSIDRDR